MTLLNIAPYLCGLAFATYFTLFQRSKLHSSVTFLVLSVITLLFSIAWFWMNKGNLGEITPRGMRLTILGSLLNGVAGILLFWVISKSNEIMVGARLTVMTIVQVAFLGLVIPLILSGGGVTPRRWVAVALGGVAIYLLR